MYSRYSQHLWLIPLTIFLALMLDIFPLPDGTVWLRPEWTLMVVIYWVLVVPDAFGVWSAFAVGIALDLLHGGLLAEHAFGLIVAAYFVLKLGYLIRPFTLLQQTGVVAILILVVKILIGLIQGSIGQWPHPVWYWMSLITSVILWPWIYSLLQGINRKSMV